MEKKWQHHEQNNFVMKECILYFFKTWNYSNIRINTSCNFFALRVNHYYLIYVLFALMYHQLSTPRPWNVTTGLFPSAFLHQSRTSTQFCKDRWQEKPACRDFSLDRSSVHCDMYLLNKSVLFISFEEFLFLASCLSL